MAPTDPRDRDRERDRDRDRDRDREDQSASSVDFFERNKKFFFGLLGFFTFCIFLIISVTLSLLLAPKPTTTLELEAKIKELTEKVEAMEANVAVQDQKLLESEDEYKLLQTHLRHSSATTLKNILIDQEKNFQSFLVVLKAGMRDLSVEIPNGTDWYDDYSNQMNKAVKRSLKRQELLGLLKTGEVPE